MITQEQIDKMLEGVEDEIREALVSELKETMKSTVYYPLQVSIKEALEEFAREEIIPEIRAALLTDKPIILKAAIESAHSIAEEITIAMIEQVRENLKTSWKRKKLAEAIFE